MDHGSAAAWIGYIVSTLLVLITFLLGLTAWLLQRQWNVQTETNNHFRETFERMWTSMSGKVGEATCKEREANTKCCIETLEADFKHHSHTEIPKTADLVIRRSNQ